jgi:hypothetical protein
VLQNSKAVRTLIKQRSILRRTFLLSLLLVCLTAAVAQPITGVWKGRVKSTNLELKIIKKGDSLTGNSYYFTGRNNYRRYSIKGYFDEQTNEVIWWDDELISAERGSPNEPSLHVADFNCPGEGKIKLDGNSTVRDNRSVSKGELHLTKIEKTQFPDEWDWVIDQYTAGASDPYIIDSIGQLVLGPHTFPEEKLPSSTVPGPVASSKPVAPSVAATPAPRAGTLSNQEKFATRQNKLQMVIPVNAPGIELKFYDNAAIDGDSIAIFLNGKPIKEHILLGGEPQTIRINTADLQDDNELVMVAENLGSIPPNTSYLVAIVGHKQYEARLFADEGSSALIRLVKSRTQ